MAQPVWVTPAGDIGNFPSGTSISFEFKANYSSPATAITYKLLNGNLPEGTSVDPIRITSNGFMVGTTKNQTEEITYTFTIRATDNLGSIRDRTFNTTVYPFSSASLHNPEGFLFSAVDSTYVNFMLDINYPVENSPYRVSLSSGRLPPGLYLEEDGVIKGFPQPPRLDNGSVVNSRNYEFSLSLYSDSGYDSKTYNITIINQEASNPPNTRTPVILNNTPLTLPLLPTDTYYRYYLPEDNTIPTANANEFFSFKIIGHDFDNQNLIYSFGSLPPGLTGNSQTGWISGIPELANDSIAEYYFNVQVSKATKPEIISPVETYKLVVTNNILQDIVWETSNDLGTVNNGDVSYLKVKATSSRTLNYILDSGELPPNITLSDEGELIGRFPFQPRSSLLNVGDTTEYTFAIKAYNPQFNALSNTKTFTVKILQYYENPFDNIYFKATQNITGRQVLYSLLNSDELIPTTSLYRPNDYNFGKATEVRFVDAYGIEPTNIQNYINASQQNFYNRKFVLGELKKAIARDENNNIIYEVVYSEVIDDLINSQGVSIPQSIYWPKPIALNYGPWFTASIEYFTSSTSVYTSYTFGYARTLYPASSTNMRVQLQENLKYNSSEKILPLWMTSQQENGSTLGYTRAWVICYTKPGLAQTIIDNINNNWNYKLNMIDFSVDRFIVDKSNTFDYNVNLAVPAWLGLPSNTPTPAPINQYDLPVLFPRKTILPIDIE